MVIREILYRSDNATCWSGEQDPQYAAQIEQLCASQGNLDRSKIEFDRMTSQTSTGLAANILERIQFILGQIRAATENLVNSTEGRVQAVYAEYGHGHESTTPLGNSYNNIVEDLNRKTHGFQANFDQEIKRFDDLQLPRPCTPTASGS